MKMKRTAENSAKKYIITGLCVALCVVLPIAFHLFPNAGKVFCPMHIPILMCGLVCGWSFGGICGIFGTLLSSLLTGMPTASVLPSMAVECAAYGVLSGLFMQVIKTKRLGVNLYSSLIFTLIVGRMLSGIITALFFSPNGYSFGVWVTSCFITALPGIIIQLSIIPTIFFTLNKTNLTPVNYSIKIEKNKKLCTNYH